MEARNCVRIGVQIDCDLVYVVWQFLLTHHLFSSPFIDLLTRPCSFFPSIVLSASSHYSFCSHSCHHGTLPDRVRVLYGPDNGQNAGQGRAIMVANLERWTYHLTLLLPCANILVTSLQCCRHVNQWRVNFLRLNSVTMHTSLPR